MTAERIKEIQFDTAYPNSVSVKQALSKVWNESVLSERERILGIIDEEIGNIDGMNHEEDNYDAGKVHGLSELIEKIKR